VVATLTPEELSLLHDHYKDTFTLIRSRESQRDKLFFWLLLVYALLIVEVQYPANTHGLLGALSVGGNTVDLKFVPLALLLDASWLLLAGLALKYCQVTKAVERQYDYLHVLEDRISDGLGDQELYRREGRAYLSRYPRLLTWAWFCYTILFPVALIVAALYLYVVEVRVLGHDLKSEVFDGAFVASIVITIGLYRFFPGSETKPAAPSYLDEVGAAIGKELHEKPADKTPPQLLRFYALLVLTKGDAVTARDVHNAWAAWMQEHQPGNDSIKPYDELDAKTQKEDDPFVEAIRRVARVWKG
jgi:hypothetical protein